MPAWEKDLDPVPLERGNVDLNKRPVVKNKDGTVSTVRSIGVNFDGREVLIPTVSDDGRILTDDQAIDAYKRSGKHLGMFKTPGEATAYAERLHGDQERQYAPKRPAWEADLDKPNVPQEKYDPTEGMSTGQRLAAGAGKSVYDTARGIGQLLRKVSPALADAVGAPTDAQVNESAKLDAPLMGTGAGAIGNVGGQVLQMAVPGALAGKVAPVLAGAAKAHPYLSAAATGAGFSATQPVVGDDSRLGNAAWGGAAGAGGQLLGAGLGAVARGGSKAIEPGVSALVAKAEKFGIPVNAAQLSDSKFLKTVNSVLEQIPLSGAAKHRNAQQDALNTNIAKLFGEDAKKVTADVYAKAKARHSAGYEDLTARNSLNLNSTKVVDELANIADEAKKMGTDDAARAVSSSVDELLSKADADGMVPGKAYQALDSQLTALIKNGGEKAHWLGRVRQSLRGGMNDSISPADQAAWKQLNREYANRKTVTDLVAKDPTGGDISASLLRGRVLATKSGKEAVASGKAGDMGDLSEVAYRFIRDPTPNSGTAQRMAVMAALGGGGQILGGVDPQDAGLNLLLALTAGRTANSALQSQALKKYMMGGVQTKIARKLLESGAAGAPIALPAISNALQQ